MEDALVKTDKESKLQINLGFLRKQTRLAQLQKDLRDIRLKLTALFGEIGARRISRVEILSNSISSAERQLRIEQKLERILDMQTLAPSIYPCSSLGLRSPQGLSFFEVAVPLSRAFVRPTRSTCNCPRDTNAPFPHTLFGRLFLGYSASRIASAFQFNSTVKGHSVKSLFFMFPLWFIRYAFQAAISAANALSHALWE